MQRKGVYPPPPGASDIPGLEVAGRVVALGEGVTKVTRGENVCALVTGGGYAEYCVAPAVQCLPIPRGLSVIEAGSLPETFFTVWSNVFDRAHLASGESLLVQGGSGGIGVTAIQIAHAFGNPVFATAGSAEKCAACEGLGATRAINYKTEDFVAVVKEATGGRGVDVILDMVGGDYLPREIAALATEGRIVLINTMGGMQSPINLRDTWCQLTIWLGCARGGYSIQGRDRGGICEKVWRLSNGKIKPWCSSLPARGWHRKRSADGVRAHRLVYSPWHEL
jgi:NADPH2:quinone reductase